MASVLGSLAPYIKKIPVSAVPILNPLGNLGKLIGAGPVVDAVLEIPQKEIDDFKKLQTLKSPRALADVNAAYYSPLFAINYIGAMRTQGNTYLGDWQALVLGSDWGRAGVSNALTPFERVASYASSRDYHLVKVVMWWASRYPTVYSLSVELISIAYAFPLVAHHIMSKDAFDMAYKDLSSSLVISQGKEATLKYPERYAELSVDGSPVTVDVTGSPKPVPNSALPSKIWAELIARDPGYYSMTEIPPSGVFGIHLAYALAVMNSGYVKGQTIDEKSFVDYAASAAGHLRYVAKLLIARSFDV